MQKITYMLVGLLLIGLIPPGLLPSKALFLDIALSMLTSLLPILNLSRSKFMFNVALRLFRPNLGLEVCGTIGVDMVYITNFDDSEQNFMVWGAYTSLVGRS